MGKSSDLEADNVVKLPSEPQKIAIPTDPAELDEFMLGLLKVELQEARRIDYSVDANLTADEIKQIENEEVFRDRFGFAFGKRGRRAVLQFISDYDLTSHDVRTLAGMRSLTWDGKKLRVKYVFWNKFFGFSQIALLSLFLLPIVIVLFQNYDAEWDVKLVLLTIISAVMFGISWVYTSFIDPFNCLRRNRCSRRQV